MAIDTLGANALASDSVTTVKIVNDAVTGAKIENNPTIAGNLSTSGNIIGGGTFSSSGLITGAAGLTLSDGNLVVADDHGLSFANEGPNATGQTATLLYDYEIGTWTPIVASGTLSGTSPTLTGRFLKIGDFVTIRFRADNSAGDLQVSSYVGFSGVPYTFTNNAQGVVVTEDIDVFARQGFASASGSALYLSACGSSSGTIALTATVSGRITN